MNRLNPATLGTSQMSAKASVVAPAKAPALIQTPTGTLSITLSPSPIPSVPLYQNVSLWIGLTTFLGVILTLIAAERRTKKELRASEDRMRLERQFSSERAHHERITNTRRTVYLDLIDEFSHTLHFLGGLGVSADRPDGAAKSPGLSVAVSKIGVVGEMETVIMARELLIQANQAIAKAMPMYMQITIRRQTQEDCDKRCKAIAAELARLQHKIAGYNEANKHDAADRQKLQADLTEATVKAKRYAPDLLAATTALFKMQTTYFELITAEGKLLNRKFDELICAIRSELGIETSQDRLRESTLGMEAEVAATAEDMTNFSSLIVQAMADIPMPNGSGPTDRSQ